LEKKLFGLVLSTNGVEVVLRDGQYFIRYDAGAHQVAWREDEISAEQAGQVQSGKIGVSQVLAELQCRLGTDAYISNWNPEN